MGIFNSIISKVSNNPAKLLFNLAKDMTKILSNQLIDNKKKEAELEILIFNSGFLIKVANSIKPHKTQQIQLEFFKEFIDYIKNEKYVYLLKEDAVKFINKRFVLYHEEINKITNSDGLGIPSKLIYNIFENPLSPESGESNDLSKGMLLMGTLVPIIEELKKETIKIVNKYY